MIKLFILIFLASCGTDKQNRQRSTDPFIDLLDKSENYAAKIAQYQDEYGFLNGRDCDSVLHSGLLAATGVEVNLTAARSESGQWFRTPDQDCYATNRSGSTISRDMLAGVMFGLYFTGDLKGLDDLRQYGKSRNWVMGEGAIDRTYFTPNFQDTLYRLTGKTYRGMPYLWIDPIKDHQRHVVALNIILRGEAQGKIDKPMLNLLKHFVKADPGNALFQYGVSRFTDGDQSRVIELLSNEDDFPYSGPVGPACSRWYWEQHQSEKFGCERMAVNTGGDFLFMMFLLNRSQQVIFQTNN